MFSVGSNRRGTTVFLKVNVLDHGYGMFFGVPQNVESEASIVPKSDHLGFYREHHLEYYEVSYLERAGRLKTCDRNSGGMGYFVAQFNPD